MTKKNRRLKAIAAWINTHCSPTLHARIINAPGHACLDYECRCPACYWYRHEQANPDCQCRVCVRHRQRVRSQWIEKHGTRAQKKAHKRDQPEGAGRF